MTQPVLAPVEKVGGIWEVLIILAILTLVAATYSGPTLYCRGGPPRDPRGRSSDTAAHVDHDRGPVHLRSQ